MVNASGVKEKPRCPMIREVMSTPIELPNWKLPKRIFPKERPMARTTNISKIGFCSSNKTTSMFTI
ncbi:Uncharacterised protein [Vibrio cholerae]|nr:Uncharacterised protein [Vibrio cholerae]CSD26274.1 Uncharacterised protein [Vibrio cholerae]